jgi:hypothetical protein
MAKAYKKTIHLSGSQLSEILAGATEMAEQPLIRAANEHAARMLEIYADNIELVDMSHLSGEAHLAAVGVLRDAAEGARNMASALRSKSKK